MPHLCGALLLAAKKMNGVFRPIAVKEVLRCLVSKCVVQSNHQEAIEYLSPLQLGVGMRNGAEAIVHAVRLALDSDSISPDCKYVLQLDFCTAFD